MKERILEALAKLDHSDDLQWTADGAPKIETVSALLGEVVKRQDIIDASPDFKRSVTTQEEKVQPVEKVERNEEDYSQSAVIAWLETAKTDEIEEVIANLEVRRDEFAAEVEALQSKMTDIKIAIKLSKLKIAASIKNSSDQDALQAYFKSEQDARMARAERRQQMLKEFDVEELDPRAPIDAAMGRQTRRGTKRPTRSMV